MCGIVGAAGLITGKEETIFKQLLIIDSLRGDHSTGIASIDTTGDVEVVKEAGDPYQLLDTYKAEALWKRSNRVLIGHNRYATQGKVNRRNAHPFEFENVVGVHNGTLHNKGALTDGWKFDVDSEALYHEIDKNGIEKAIKKARGAWALVYWDKVMERLCFLRNSERPLHYIFSEDNKTMFWASEAWMLTAILNRSDYKIGSIQKLPEDTLLSFDIGLKPHKDMEEIAKPHAKTLKQEVAVVQPQEKKHLGVAVGAGSPVVVGGTSTSFDSDYMGSGEILFEIVSIQKDDNNQEYLVLSDALNPRYDVRCYFNQGKTFRESVGRYCTGKVTSIMAKPLNGGCYYKVSPWSVDLMPAIPAENKPKIDTIHVPYYKNGREIPVNVFKHVFHSCSYCSSSIQYGDVCEVIDDSGMVLCKDCLAEPEILKYLK